jgi:hypothetical protein
MNDTFRRAALLAACAAITPAVLADSGARPDDHAPIGVMADHYHEAGEWMVSYRYMRMDMEGNRRGTDSIAPDTIATTIPNRFFGQPMQPPTLRAVPTEMSMDMHMLGAMYAPTDRVTLMAMVNYLIKDMDHLTYAGPTGSEILGEFTTRTEGLGDASISALVRLHEQAGQRLHLQAGVSVPLGSIDEQDQILTPMGMRPSPRLPYPMQLGSGTWDPIIGLTWSRLGERISGGVQWRSVFRVHDNDEDYRLGDEHRLTGWLAWRFAEHVSASLRLEGLRRGNISGQDPAIVAPVQTADPDRQGIERWSLGLGVNWIIGGGHRLAAEWLTPIHQDLDGPQLETDDTVTLGWQWSF